MAYPGLRAQHDHSRQACCEQAHVQPGDYHAWDFDGNFRDDLALAGCDRSKSPDDVARDVAKAEQKSSDMVAKSEVHAQSSLDKSADKVSEQLVHFDNDAARQAYDIAIARADGNRKVALASCESQSGDAQKACKDQAEADYKAAAERAIADNRQDKQPDQ